MATLSVDAPCFTVMVSVAVPPSHRDELVAIMLETAPVFAAQPGFVSSHLHRSHDMARVINYIQWRDAAAHEACMASAEVAAGGQPFMDFVERHGLEVDVRTFDVVHSEED